MRREGRERLAGISTAPSPLLLPCMTSGREERQKLDGVRGPAPLQLRLLYFPMSRIRYASCCSSPALIKPVTFHLTAQHPFLHNRPEPCSLSVLSSILSFAATGVRAASHPYQPIRLQLLPLPHISSYHFLLGRDFDRRAFPHTRQSAIRQRLYSFLYFDSWQSQLEPSMMCNSM